MGGVFLGLIITGAEAVGAIWGLLFPVVLVAILLPLAVRRYQRLSR